MSTVGLVLHFLASHPTVLLGIMTGWQVFSAIVTAVFKRRTPEEQERFKAVAPAWLFGLVALCETLGVNLPGLLHLFDPFVRALLQFLGLKGVDSPPPPP